MKAYALAEALSGRVTGDSNVEITRAVHPTEAAESGDMAVAISPDTISLLSKSRAKVALVLEGSDTSHLDFAAMILVGRSRTNLSRITNVFQHRDDVSPGVHPTAVVSTSASIGVDASIGPLAVIGPGVSIGARSVILSQATIGAGAAVGEECLLHAGVRIGWGCRIGDRAILHHNVSIGSDGFSFVPERPGAAEAAMGSGNNPYDGPERNALRKIHSLSIVELGDDVEIGALTAIDRGTLKATRIGSGTKVDDLVMIGHNVEVGLDCLLCGQVGLAGGVIIGDGAVLGGRVGVADHLRIGSRAVIGAAACVATNVPDGAIYAGYPAVPRAEALENLRLMRRMRRLLTRSAEAKP